MREVQRVLAALAEDASLSGERVAAVLAAQGWTARRRANEATSPRVWARGGLLAQIVEGDPTRAEFTLWEGEFDEDLGYEGLDALYDEAVDRMRLLAGEVEASGRATRLPEGNEALTEGIDYIDHAAWRVSRRIMRLGVLQHDTDLPVYIVAVIT